METQTFKKCTGCSRAPQALSEFCVGEKEFKNCQKCRDKGKRKDEARRQDPVKREQKNEQLRNNKYYQTHRERKKAELQRQRRSVHVTQSAE